MTESGSQLAAAPPDDVDLQDSEGTALRQFVTFLLGDEVFAVDVSGVQEIIRVPDIVRMPLAPPALEGLANLRGQVLPIVSLRRLLHLEPQALSDAARALVIDLGQPLGFVVDRVISVVAVETRKIEPVDRIQTTVDTDVLAGVIKDVGDVAVVMVLDFGSVVAKEFAGTDGVQRLTEGMSEPIRQATADGEDDESGDELRLVSFTVAGQEYAMPVEDVQEIVQMPEHVVRVPRTASHVLGVMTLRNRLLPLLSLRQAFGLPAPSASDRARVMVVALDHELLGVVTDSVNEVLRVPKAKVNPLPGVLKRDGVVSDLTAMCQLDEGRRIVTIVSAQRLFSRAAVEEAKQAVDDLAHQQQQVPDDEEEQSSGDEEYQVVVFRLDKEEFGLPIESVQEIVRVPEQLTRVPQAPAEVEGVMNLRGTVLPVLDLRRRLGLPTAGRTDRQRVMVLLSNGTRTGFVVDAVSEVLKISRSVIQPAPAVAHGQDRLVTQVANLSQQRRIVQLIDPVVLLQGSELHHDLLVETQEAL